MTIDIQSYVIAYDFYLLDYLTKEKNMKKLSILLICLFLLTACGGNNNSNGNDSNTNNAEKETFTVGMECAYAPFNYQISSPSETSVKIDGGYCDGYDVMIASRIAESLGKELVIKKISWGGLITALQNDEIDAIIAGMTANEEREEGVDFTDPYYDSHGMIMIVRKDSEEASFNDIQQFSGKNVVGQLGTNYDDVIDQIEGVNHITPKQTYPEMILALRFGDVDAITAEMAVASGVVSANDDLAIVEFAEGKGFECDTTVSIGLKEGSRGNEFYNSVSEALASISDETRAELMAQAVEQQPASN